VRASQCKQLKCEIKLIHSGKNVWDGVRERHVREKGDKVGYRYGGKERGVGMERGRGV
jgi:hypothetical protein